MARVSEVRTEGAARELLAVRGWSVARPPRGNVIFRSEYRDFPLLAEGLAGASKSGKGDGIPDFIVVDRASLRPLIVGETKAAGQDINKAAREAQGYADAMAEREHRVLAAGIAGDGEHEIAVRVLKRGPSKWLPIAYRDDPIQWLPTPEETDQLLADPTLFHLDPRVPSPEVLADRGDEINRILRESDIKDEYRPAVIAAFMLALAQTKGAISPDPEWVLQQVNAACARAFRKAGKDEIADSIRVNEANEKLAARGGRICRILRLLSVTNLTAAHDYLGQLYETFFRFTGGNTIGQYFTPRHVAAFIADLMEVSERDVVVDPACGTGGFLIASLYRMMGRRKLTNQQIGRLVAGHLYGFESEPITAALCVANMILRGDGKTGVYKGDCFTDERFPVGAASVVLGNPPFPHRGTGTPPEEFVNRGLEALEARGQLAMIVPTSLVATGEKAAAWRRRILARNTLVAAITLPDELFEPFATAYPTVVVLQKGVQHRPDKKVFFARISNDGLRLRKRVRVPIPGDQLPGCLDAFRQGTDEPGKWAWARLSGAEWTPAAYIESAPADETDIRREVEQLLRSEAAFHARFAGELSAFREKLASGELRATKHQAAEPELVDETEIGTLGRSFEIRYGQKALHNKSHLAAGPSLIISSSGENNGCYGFFDFENLTAPPFATVPSTGTIGHAFVQHWPCGVTDDCLLMFPRAGVPDEALYVAAAVVRLERWRFSYGRKATPDRIAGFKLPLSEPLLAWVRKRQAEVARLSGGIVRSFTSDERGRAEFMKLTERWKRDRSVTSSAARMANHPAYLRIIGMGPRAIPFLLEELRRGPDHWFVALHAITGEDPVPVDARGRLPQMADAWLAWGEKEGYI